MQIFWGKSLTESIDELKYSPCGRFLAAGSHDQNIDIFDVQVRCEAHAKKIKAKKPKCIPLYTNHLAETLACVSWIVSFLVSYGSEAHPYPACVIYQLQATQHRLEQSKLYRQSKSRISSRKHWLKHLSSHALSLVAGLIHSLSLMSV